MQPRLKQLFVEAGLNPGQLVQLNAAGTAWAAGLRFTAAASSSPAVGDDDTVGYAPGSIWVRLDTDEAWICVDAQTGAAIWAELGLGANVYQEEYAGDVIAGGAADTALSNPAANLPVKSADTFRLYMNGILQRQGAGNDYTIVIATGVVTWLTTSGTAIEMDATDVITYIYESTT